MKIEIDYKPNDWVYMIHGAEVHHVRVENVSISVVMGSRGQPEVITKYSVRPQDSDLMSIPKNRVFKTKEELLESL